MRPRISLGHCGWPIGLNIRGLGFFYKGNNYWELQIRSHVFYLRHTRFYKGDRSGRFLHDTDPYWRRTVGAKEEA